MFSPYMIFFIKYLLRIDYENIFYYTQNRIAVTGGNSIRTRAMIN